MDVLKAIAALEELGIELTPEQQEAMAAHKTAAMYEEAEKVFARKLTEFVLGEKRSEKRAEDWTRDMFALAGRVAVNIIGSNVGRGRGEVHEKMFRIETPSGSLKVSLTTDPE